MTNEEIIEKIDGYVGNLKAKHSAQEKIQSAERYARFRIGGIEHHLSLSHSYKGILKPKSSWIVKFRQGYKQPIIVETFYSYDKAWELYTKLNTRYNTKR